MTSVSMTASGTEIMSYEIEKAHSSAPGFFFYTLLYSTNCVRHCLPRLTLS